MTNVPGGAVYQITVSARATSATPANKVNTVSLSAGGSTQTATATVVVTDPPTPPPQPIPTVRT